MSQHIKDRFLKLKSLDDQHIESFITYYIKSALHDIDNNITNINDEINIINESANLIVDISISLKKRFNATYKLYKDEKELNSLIKLPNFNLRLLNNKYCKLSIPDTSEFYNQIQTLKSYCCNVLYKGKLRRLNISDVGRSEVEIYFPTTKCSVLFLTTTKQMLILESLNNSKYTNYNKTVDEIALINRKVILVVNNKITLADSWNYQKKLSTIPNEIDYKKYYDLMNRNTLLNNLTINAIKIYHKYSLNEIYLLLSSSKYEPQISNNEIVDALDRLINNGYVVFNENKYILAY